MSHLKKLSIHAAKKYCPIVAREKVQRIIGREIYNENFDRLRCIYIHIPKTAGTSIGRALFGTGQIGHWSADTYHYTNPEKYGAYFKFTVVRNPWDRLASAFYYLKQGGKNQTDKEWAEKNLKNYADINSFVGNWLSDESIYSWGHFKPQSSFLEIDKQELNVDYIARFENLADDYKTICSRLRLDVPLGKYNSSNRPGYRDVFTGPSIDKVARVYARDITRFHYDF